MNSYIWIHIWIHMIFSYMNSYVSWIHIWIRVYQGSRWSEVTFLRLMPCSGPALVNRQAQPEGRRVPGAVDIPEGRLTIFFGDIFLCGTGLMPVGSESGLQDRIFQVLSLCPGQSGRASLQCAIPSNAAMPSQTQSVTPAIIGAAAWPWRRGPWKAAMIPVGATQCWWHDKPWPPIAWLQEAPWTHLVLDCDILVVIWASWCWWRWSRTAVCCLSAGSPRQPQDKDRSRPAVSGPGSPNDPSQDGAQDSNSCWRIKGGLGGLDTKTPDTCSIRRIKQQFNEETVYFRPGMQQGGICEGVRAIHV